MQDPHQNDCEDCHNGRVRCSPSQCRAWNPVIGEQLVALWTVKRIRHRDVVYGHRYELEYTLSPISAVLDHGFLREDGGFDYNVPGHVFIIKTDPNRATTQGTTWTNNYVHFEGSRPTFPHGDVSFTKIPTLTTPDNSAKEIELYKELISSLAMKTSTSFKPIYPEIFDATIQKIPVTMTHHHTTTIPSQSTDQTKRTQITSIWATPGITPITQAASTVKFPTTTTTRYSEADPLYHSTTKKVQPITTITFFAPDDSVTENEIFQPPTTETQSPTQASVMQKPSSNEHSDIFDYEEEDTMTAKVSTIQSSASTNIQTPSISTMTTTSRTEPSTTKKNDTSVLMTERPRETSTIQFSDTTSQGESSRKTTSDIVTTTTPKIKRRMKTTVSTKEPSKRTSTVQVTHPTTNQTPSQESSRATTDILSTTVSTKLTTKKRTKTTSTRTEITTSANMRTPQNETPTQMETAKTPLSMLTTNQRTNTTSTTGTAPPSKSTEGTRKPLAPNRTTLRRTQIPRRKTTTADFDELFPQKLTTTVKSMLDSTSQTPKSTTPSIFDVSLEDDSEESTDIYTPMKLMTTTVKKLKSTTQVTPTFVTEKETTLKIPSTTEDGEILIAQAKEDIEQSITASPSTMITAESTTALPLTTDSLKTFTSSTLFQNTTAPPPTRLSQTTHSSTIFSPPTTLPFTKEPEITTTSKLPSTIITQLENTATTEQFTTKEKPTITTIGETEMSTLETTTENPTTKITFVGTIITRRPTIRETSKVPTKQSSQKIGQPARDIVDIFGEEQPTALEKPTVVSQPSTPTEDDFLFGSDVPQMPAETEEALIIFDNFFEASTSNPSITERTNGEHSTTTSSPQQDTQTETESLTSTSYITSISFQVNGKNKTKATTMVKANVSKIATNTTDFEVFKAVMPDTTESNSNFTDVKQQFDHLALSLINHARTIDILSNNKTKTTKNKRRRSFNGRRGRKRKMRS